MNHHQLSEQNADALGACRGLLFAFAMLIVPCGLCGLLAWVVLR